MGADPYKSGMIKKSPYGPKRDLEGGIVAILDFKNEKRDMELLSYPSRCICKNEIHELVCTDEENPVPGGHVDRAAYLGFFEIEVGGVIVAGDEVWCDDKLVGHIAGFEDCHFPNHYDILMKSDELLNGVERNLHVGSRIRIHKKVD